VSALVARAVATTPVGPTTARVARLVIGSGLARCCASILYPPLETAKLNDLDPAVYLGDAVRAARRGEILLPIA
jgi:hypothetical protein